jgi:integrase
MTDANDKREHLRGVFQHPVRKCSGRTFEVLRNAAIIRLFVDTGMRRAELLGLPVDDLDLDQDVAVVAGKGGRQRACLTTRTRAQPKRPSTDDPSCHTFAHQWLAAGGTVASHGRCKSRLTWVPVGHVMRRV